MDEKLNIRDQIRGMILGLWMDGKLIPKHQNMTEEELMADLEAWADRIGLPPSAYSKEQN